MNTDVLIVGSGCSGLYCALNLPRNLKITMITKSGVEESDSYLAQGGICVLRGQEDFPSFLRTPFGRDIMRTIKRALRS